MLYILTGDIQIGKSRWLLSLVDDLAQEGVTCFGVLAPGIWVKAAGSQADENGFEKLGIENVLLPEKRRVRFADRVDIAKRQGTFEAESEAGKIGMIWHIYDDALAEVTDYFAKLVDRRDLFTPDACERRCLLVVDELGRLELWNDGGLTAATKLLAAGPVGCMQNALVVVRDYLVDIAEEKYATIWGGALRITPSETSARFIQKRLVQE